MLIDGQQRITAMKTALGGQPVIDDSCNKVIIKIAFHPVAERFEVLHPAILEDKVWGFMIVLKSSGLSFQRFSSYKILNCLKFSPELAVQPFGQIVIWLQFRCKRY